MSIYKTENSNALLKYLDKQEEEKVMQITKKETYTSGQNIIETGDRNRDILLIEHGEVEVVIQNDKTNAQSIAKLETGEFFGEMNFVLPIRRTATIRAIGEVIIQRYGYSELCTLLKEEPLIASKIFSAINEFQTQKMHNTIEQVLVN